MPKNLFQKIYTIILRIPKGKVATYGQIAAMTGNPRAARTVGWALNNSPDNLKLPWHRVISYKGVSSLPTMAKRRLQEALLEQEGIQFDRNDKINLEKYQWNGK